MPQPQWIRGVDQIMVHHCESYFHQAAQLLAAGVNEGIAVLAIVQFTHDATEHDIYAALKTMADDRYVARVGVSHEFHDAERFEALADRMGTRLSSAEGPPPPACDHP